VGAALAVALVGVLLAGHGGGHDREAPDVPPLRGIDRSRFVGVAVRGAQLDDAGYASAAGRLFDATTPENELKWETSEPERGRYDFGPADRVVAFGREHGMHVRGHTLVWHNQNPGWLVNGHFSRAELIALLRDHIRTLMHRYAGRIAEWDVVNEAVDDDGRLRDTLWLRGIGPQYIPLAFRFAHEADPRAKLVYNDYGAEGTGVKADAVYRLVATLVRAHVPIDAVGFQTHVETKPIPGFVENLRRFAALGLDIELTEIDVRVPDHASAADLRAQTDQYRTIIGACRALPACRGMVFWGLDDADSWIPGAYPGFGDATLFDADLHAKPAYGAVREALLAG
jgi:endo-1,4-beta-xylanase